jgi:thiamine-phosphate pyrophosphorylase
MEEYARLGLDDAGLTAAIKQARHALAGAVLDLEGMCVLDEEDDSARETPPTRGGATWGGSLIAHRDIVGDVGCEVSTPSEYERSGECDVAVAAGKRLSEALRVVEEYGKTIDRDFAAAIERLRYRGYELQRRLELTAASHGRFGNVRLYVLVTESLCSGDWFATAEAALAGGAHCLQLREKELPDRELLDRAKRLVTLCRQRNALLIVNDRPDIAVLSNAHGLHLGQTDVTVADARRILPSTMIVGVSTHTPEQLTAAAEVVPDYIAVGPIFPTATKPQDYIAGPQALAAARRSTSLPLVAVGGIDAENAREVLSAGHCCLCVCRSVISQPDVANAAARLRAVIDQTGTAADAGGHA